jgi:hypothetical protein
VLASQNASPEAASTTLATYGSVMTATASDVEK